MNNPQVGNVYVLTWVRGIGKALYVEGIAYIKVDKRIKNFYICMCIHTFTYIQFQINLTSIPFKVFPFTSTC